LNTRKPAAAKSAKKASAKPGAKSPASSKKGLARKAPGKKAAVKKAAAKKAEVRKSPARAALAQVAEPNASTPQAPAKLPAEVAKLRKHVLNALDDLKAKDVKEIDIRGRASFADLLVIASGTSTRHVKSLADEVVKFVKKAGMMPLGVEGEKEAEWVLVDLGDIVCHIMLPRIRDFYALESLWSVGAHDAESEFAG
jgi:ribosome silencing factor RsfS/YbeB/iojap